MNRQYLDPIFFGSYPEELATIFGEAWPARVGDRDFETIQEPIDFLGVNYYTRAVVRHDAAAPPVRVSAVPQPENACTETGWEVVPEALTGTLLWVRERYGAIPLYITENGAAFYDPPRPIRGRIDDPLRIEYLRAHLLAAHAAIRHGVDLRGYFVWSLLDNLEWSAGYTKRFGIVHVDYATQKRTLKASAHFYRDVIAGAGAVLGG
jgi:beta-glucosidase